MLNSIQHLDSLISQNISTLWDPALTKFMTAVSSIINPTPIAVLSVLLVASLAYQKKHQYSFLVALSMLSGLAIETMFKVIFHRTRPEPSLIEMNDFSLPSAHSTMSLIFFSLIIFIWKDKIKNIYLRSLFVAGNVFLILIVGFSRIYLNVHWLSDVISGYLLGGLVLILIITILSRRLKFN